MHPLSSKKADAVTTAVSVELWPFVREDTQPDDEQRQGFQRARNSRGHPAEKGLLRPSLRLLGTGDKREHQWVDPSVSAKGEEL